MTNDEKYTSKILNICKAVISLALLIIFSIMRNPDSDIYWMIETGKWIYKHKTVPFTNPWTITENLSVIVQQPLCALLNYGFSSLLGISNLWILAFIEEIILLSVCLYVVFANQKDNSYTVSICTFVLVSSVLLVCCGMVTTRPYLLTTTNMIIFIFALQSYLKNKSFVQICVLTAIVTLFQTNYQMASLIAIPLFLSCFFVGYLTEAFIGKVPFEINTIAKWILLYVEVAIISLINPYGLNGATYLLKSKDAINLLKDKILETNKPTILSISFVMIVVTSCIAFTLIRQKRLPTPAIYLWIGSCIATAMTNRNVWMCFISFIFLIADIKFTRLPYQSILPKISLRFKRMFCSIFTITVVTTGFVYVTSYKNTDDLEELFSLIREIPEDESIYTTFNTGGYVEYLGRKCYIDARPELYSTAITEGKDVLKEWYDLEYNNKTDIREFITTNNFDYYLVTNSSTLYTYLKYSDNSLLWSNNEMSLYQIYRRNI